MAKQYTVFNETNAHLSLPSGAYMSPKGDSGKHDRAFPVEIPSDHLLWKMAKGDSPEVRIVEGDATAEKAEKLPSPQEAALKKKAKAAAEKKAAADAKKKAEAEAAKAQAKAEAEAQAAAEAEAEAAAQAEVEALAAAQAEADAKAAQSNKTSEEPPGDILKDEMDGVMEGLSSGALEDTADKPAGKSRSRRSKNK